MSSEAPPASVTADKMDVDEPSPATPKASTQPPAAAASTSSKPTSESSKPIIPKSIEEKPRHKALLIGIRYLNTSHPLAGPHNDVRNVHTWLTYTYPFHPHNILILTEDQPDHDKWPTRDNILRGLRWLSEGSRETDRLFLHYSGHGGAVLDEDGDEVDGMDESIIPLDYEETGEILDDDIFKITIAPLAKNARLTAIFDCCHSGSVMDLQYSYTPQGELEVQRNDARAPILEAVGRGIRQALVGHKAHAKAELHAAYRFFKTRGLQKKKSANDVKDVKALRDRSTEATVVQFSACNDYERSVDLGGFGTDARIMSWAILQCLSENQHPTLVELFAKTRKLVADKYKQSVILSTGGIVRVVHDSRYPLKINYLKVRLKGETKCTFITSHDSTELVHRQKLLVSELAPLLTIPETLSPESRLDIPFQINLPDPDHPSEIVRVAIRVANLLPPSFGLIGKSSGNPFDARTVYTIVAEMEETATLFSFAKVREGEAKIEPFLAYDPRLLPALIQPDSKRWRSAPGESPIEYEVELSATTLGPGDVFRLAYRLAVAREDALKGVRIKRVSLLIREHRSLGTVGSRPSLRSSVEIVRWDFDEGPPPEIEGKKKEGEGSIEMGELKPRRKTAGGFSRYVPDAHPGVGGSSGAGSLAAEATSGSRTPAGSPRASSGALRGASRSSPAASSSRSPYRVGSQHSPSRSPTRRRMAYRFADSWSSGPGGDGLYVERDIELTVPDRGNYAPTTPRPSDPSLLQPLKQNGPVALVEIKHTLQVRVELTTIHKTVVMECGCVLASVGRAECERVLDESPEVMPTLDYDKIFGNDVWVPPYEILDPVMVELRRREEEEALAALEEEDDEDDESESEEDETESVDESFEEEEVDRGRSYIQRPFVETPVIPEEPPPEYATESESETDEDDEVEDEVNNENDGEHNEVLEEDGSSSTVNLRPPDEDTLADEITEEPVGGPTTSVRNVPIPPIDVSPWKDAKTISHPLDSP
ncbi:Ca(2+)-dependent cysteine protease [Phlyctochytrium planicorne]|nr:Ca(2+)-dependent cysteine protease [Phlyctochytrium planicorne]